MYIVYLNSRSNQIYLKAFDILDNQNQCLFVRRESFLYENKNIITSIMHHQYILLVTFEFVRICCDILQAIYQCPTLGLIVGTSTTAILFSVTPPRTLCWAQIVCNHCYPSSYCTPNKTRVYEIYHAHGAISMVFCVVCKQSYPMCGARI